MKTWRAVLGNSDGLGGVRSEQPPDIISPWCHGENIPHTGTGDNFAARCKQKRHIPSVPPLRYLRRETKAAIVDGDKVNYNRP